MATQKFVALLSRLVPMKTFGQTFLSQLLLWIHIAVRREQRVEAQQRQIHSQAAVLPLAPAVSGAAGGRRWGGQVSVSRVVMVVVVVGWSAAVLTADQKGPTAVAVGQHAGGRQQHQDQRAEQEEKHVHAFGLC